MNPDYSGNRGHLPPVRVFFNQFDPDEDPPPDPQLNYPSSYVLPPYLPDRHDLHPGSRWSTMNNSHNHDNFYDQGTAAGRPQPSLNVHLTVPPGENNSMAADGSHTPNTPEILNSILSLQQDHIAGYHGPLPIGGNEILEPSHLREVDSIPMVPPLHDGSLSSHQGHSHALMASDGGAPMPTTSGAPPSVQHFRSQFIKEGLKIKVQQNLGACRGRHTSEESIASTSVSSPANPATPNSEGVAVKSEELTEEDEIRRQRRRERNKVAATKCRNKKKQRTQLLVKESEVLVEQNRHLKTEINKLEVEKKRLMDVLSLHQPNCAKRLRSSEEDPDQLLGNLESGSHDAQHQQLSILPGHSSSGYQGFQDDQNTVTSGSFAQGQNPDEGNSRYYSDDQDMGSFHFSTDIKTEESGGQLDMAFLQGTCGTNYSATNPTSTSPSSGPFLVKRHVPNLYLDMDSRCIAL